MTCPKEVSLVMPDFVARRLSDELDRLPKRPTGCATPLALVLARLGVRRCGRDSSSGRLTRQIDYAYDLFVGPEDERLARPRSGEVRHEALAEWASYLVKHLLRYATDYVEDGGDCEVDAGQWRTGAALLDRPDADFYVVA
jgi:hypothetical protein